MSWTPERIERLKELVDQGLTAEQIARELGGGITHNAVIGKIQRLGLKLRGSAIWFPRPGKPRQPRVRAPKQRWVPPPPPPAQFAEAATAAPPDPSKFACTLLQLNDKTCRWPLGDPQEPDFHFCGVPPREGQPYCDHHCSMAFDGGRHRMSADEREERRELALREKLREQRRSAA